MKKLTFLEVFSGVLIFILCFNAYGQESQLKLEKFSGGFFSINKPKGWEVITAGECAEFAFLIRDPSEPLRQIFYLGEVGPVYLCAEQKQIDYQYVSMGGYPCDWLEMPVVYPLTPGNFLATFHLIAKTERAQRFMSDFPKLENLQIISAVAQPGPISGGNTEVIRALFTDGGKVGEGLFLVTVAPLLPYSGSPGGGIAAGFVIIGITARKREFPKLENMLVKSVSTFSINKTYVDNCLSQQASVYGAVLKTGKMLSETSDIIIQGWESRNKVDYIIA